MAKKKAGVVAQNVTGFNRLVAQQKSAIQEGGKDSRLLRNYNKLSYEQKTSMAPKTFRMVQKELQRLRTKKGK